jgi:threonyl-tRNA synthetase
MLHRALFGSLERFTGILLENYAGRLPVWLAPLQVMVVTITSDADDYAEEVAQALVTAGVRAESDIRNEKISYKVREHSVNKVPVLLVVGGREMEQRRVTVRRLGRKEQDNLGLEEAVRQLAEEALPPKVGARVVGSEEAIPATA